MKWTLLLTAPNQLTAEMWKTMLVNNGIPAVVRQEDTPSYLGVSARPCRLLVSEDKLEEARALLDREQATEA
ncbi:MAG: DUF2007 domain-containing protein [Dehalococcoidia bacterium]